MVFRLGVFIAQSSVKLINIRKTWILPILQAGMVAMILIQVVNPYMTTIWLMFTFVLIEGMIGGATYVNTFFAISNKVGIKMSK